MVLRGIILISLIISCSKERCYECNVITVDNGKNKVIEKKEACGSKDDIREFERRESGQVFRDDGKLLTTTTCECY